MKIDRKDKMEEKLWKTEDRRQIMEDRTWKTEDGRSKIVDKLMLSYGNMVWYPKHTNIKSMNWLNLKN